METKTSQEIEFNVSKVLIIIENDRDLDAMFREKYGTDYKMCHTLINSGSGMKSSATSYVKGLFVGIILEKKALLDKYLALKDDGASEGVEVKELVGDTYKIATHKEEKKKVNNKKRWGVKAIADDVKEFFNGKDKQIHRTGEKVQLLKKIFTRLEQRMWNERFTKETLTDEQLREIGGAVETFNKKIESIINPKK